MHMPNTHLKEVSMTHSPFFEGQLLLAMNGLDPEDAFHRSVVYICSHDESGAMGLIINQAIEKEHQREQQVP